MKTFIKKLSSATILAGLFINQAFAAGTDLVNPDAGGIGATTKTPLGSSITTLINYFLGLLGLIAVGFLIYAGVLMVTAGGKEEQVTKAKKIIMYAVGGIVIILLSYTIVTFVASALG